MGEPGGVEVVLIKCHCETCAAGRSNPLLNKTERQIICRLVVRLTICVRELALRAVALGGGDSVWEQKKKLEARKMLAAGAADRASEPQANIAHSKRVSAGAPQRQVHALLGSCEGREITSVILEAVVGIHLLDLRH